MRIKVLAVAMLILAAGWALAAAANNPQEDIIYAEGIGLDGFPVTEDLSGTPKTIVDSAENVMVDWSDNLVFHQFPVGQKVRTEVILHDMIGSELGPAVFTLTGHLKIEMIDNPGGEVVGGPFYDSLIIEGIWTDGPNDYYSAEINQEGNLLYGYNWETRGLEAGWYRLTFWIDRDYNYPDETSEEYGNSPITYRNVGITSHAPGDTDTSAGDIVGFVYDDFSNDISWIEIELLPKDKGRK